MSNKGKDENDGAEEKNDVFKQAEKEGDLTLLLNPTAADVARMTVPRYYNAESLFFGAMQVALQQLAKKGFNVNTVCSHQFGPSRWLSVFQLASQLTAKAEGDLTLCALFACFQDMGRDWRDHEKVRDPAWIAEAVNTLSHTVSQWLELDAVLLEHLPAELVPQVSVLLARTIFWSGNRWYEDDITPEAHLQFPLEGFHPALLAAAHACMDATYIWECVWEFEEANPKHAHTLEGRMTLQGLHDGMA